MDPELARLSRTVDGSLLGQRIRNARFAAGLTQDELAHGVASAAYISKIEAGHRRPGATLLAHIAERLSVPVEALVLGQTQDHRLGTELELDYAELALKSGDADAALAGVEDVLDGPDLPRTPSQVVRARSIRASALEVTGNYQGAIAELEALVADSARDLRWIGMLIALSRCYRISGDLSRAIDVGHDAEKEIERQGLTGTEEAIRLAVTVAGALMDRGEVSRALQICQRAMEQADEVGSALARASAYWNASVAQSLQGDVPSAVLLAKKALMIFESSGDARTRARLQGQLARMQLMMDPPDLEAAESNVVTALEIMRWSDATVAEQTNARLVTAKISLRKGQLEQAERIAEDCFAAADNVAPLVAADACLVLGRVALATQRRAQADRWFEKAVLLLTGCGADRYVAECWFELGALLQEAGDERGAMDAYRRAAASTGLPVPDLSSTPAPVGRG